MRLDRSQLTKPDHAHPETARAELVRHDFEQLNPGDELEVFQRGNWTIERHERGKDLWVCREGHVRWYIGRLKTALALAIRAVPQSPDPAPHRDSSPARVG